MGGLLDRTCGELPRDGAPTPTQSMCACWAHWMALPEDLRSEFLKSYGRDEFANYHLNILKAVEIWRGLGVWRVPIDEYTSISGQNPRPVATASQVGAKQGALQPTSP